MLWICCSHLRFNCLLFGVSLLLCKSCYSFYIFIYFIFILYFIFFVSMGVFPVNSYNTSQQSRLLSYGYGTIDSSVFCMATHQQKLGRNESPNLGHCVGCMQFRHTTKTLGVTLKVQQWQRNATPYIRVICMSSCLTDSMSHYFAEVSKLPLHTCDSNPTSNMQ